MRKHVVRSAAAALLCAVLWSPRPIAGQSAAASREERWRADLQTFAREFAAKQLDFAKLYSAERFDAAVAAIDKTLGQATDADVVLSLMKPVASANVARARPA